MVGFFARLKGRDGPNKIKSKKHGHLDQLANQKPQKPRWDDAWTRTTVDPEEVQDLIRRCTEELKARALDLPFLLLPFRPTSDPSAVRTFIRHFFDGSQPPRGELLSQELRMTEPMVISGVVKWCWSRLPGGVVGWDSYELFKVGEQDSNMARDSFKTFIPLSVEADSRSAIIFDFFNLLSAIAAHGKTNGFSGRKLSRMASWWAFEQKDSEQGFEPGYKAWLSAADATSHLFFAYLRSLGPQTSLSGISMLPMSLQKLLQETEYPPQRPSLTQSSTNKVIMIVDTVSPTPFALLRRANHFQYRDEDRALQEYSEYEDPVLALTEECRRVLRAISAANQSQAVSSSKHSTSLRDASWSRFEDIGFASALEEEDEDDDGKPTTNRRANGLRTIAASGGIGLDRPTTPSWADFLSSGFVDDGPNSPSNLLLPPDKILPPIETTVRQRSSQSHRPRLESDRHLEPGELASITHFDLDDSFWWVWMSSLAPEETAERKSAFGRCAVIETIIRSGRWLVMEEMVKGAAPEPEIGAYIAEKKSFFSWTRRNRGGISRRKSTGKHALDRGDGRLKATSTSVSLSKSSIGPDQHAKIQAAAARLQARQLQEKQELQNRAQERRGRNDTNASAEKTNSVLTLQPVILSEASPAMKWANKYDKESIREAYLSNSNAGRGVSAGGPQTNGHTAGTTPAVNGHDRAPEVPSKAPSKAPAALPLASPVAKPKSPYFAPDDVDSEPGSARLTEKALEAPKDVHPAERSASAAGPSSPPPPPKEQNMAEFLRDSMVSPEPDMSPESKKHQKKLQKEKEKAAAPPSSGGGLRKLFGRKNRQSKLPENAASQLKEMGVKEEEESVAPEPVTPTPQPAKPVKAPVAREEAPIAPPPQKAPEPTPIAAPVPVKAPAPMPEPLVDDAASRLDTADALEAKDEFSRFDQGPLLDQPSFVPDVSGSDEDDDAVPPPIARHTSRSPMSSPKSPKAEPEAPKAAAVQDRWARIRQNAAERATQRTGDESSASPPSKTVEGDDDTSGEETIESRVARIKARVAELTGNVEGLNGPGNRTPPPIRR